MCSVSHQRIGTWTGGLGNKRTSRDHPNYSIVEIGQNTEKSPGDLTRLAVTQTPGKNHHQMLVWKTLKRAKIKSRRWWWQLYLQLLEPFWTILKNLEKRLGNKKSEEELKASWLQSCWDQLEYLEEVWRAGELERLAVTQTLTKTISYDWFKGQTERQSFFFNWK